MLPLLGVFAMSACNKDETLSGYGATDTVWTLVELDGRLFAAQVALSFPEKGRIAGQAPCNRFSSTQAAPYPWFKAGPIAATRMTCRDMKAEQAFLQALETMSLSEVSDDTLILSNDDGREMLFKATAPDA